MRVIEPLYSARLDPGAFWRGVGNVALLEPDVPLVSARISQRCDAGGVAEAVSRLSVAVDKGFAIISDFLSPGEHALRDMLLARGDARFIVALANQMPYGYKPDSRFLKPIQEGRCLVIAKGNEDRAFGRGACLDINEEIKAIAYAGAGYYTYWRPEGAQVLCTC